MTPEAGLLIMQGGGASDHKGWKAIEEVLRHYAESRLASYARLVIGLSHAREFFDPKSRSFRPPDCPRAIEELEEALRRLQDPLFAATGTASLAECLRKLGREREIGAAVEAYFTRHPGARRLPGIPEMMPP
jgi:hypothetical protein